MVEFGFNNPLLVDSRDGIVAGHGRLLAARKLGLAEVPVIVLDHLSETQRQAYLLADNRLALSAGWSEERLAEELAALEAEGFELSALGFTEHELADLLAEHESPAAEAEDEVPLPPAQAVTEPGDLWFIGPHRLICGDCRDTATVAPEDYLEWYRDVAASIASVLAPDGSYFLNIKEHAEEGQRRLYVKKLVIAHVDEWGWRFIDEFCWRKSDNGVPGGWSNRFKNAWEPIAHFSRSEAIKFHPYAVGHPSGDCFDYSPDTPRSASGSGLLGEHEDRHGGLARPSNVIEAKTESSQGAHSAPFPRAIPEFFIKAFSDPGDAILDPFLGSGTTLAAAHVLDRVGYGIEISPAYCDVIVRRIEHLAGLEPVLATGEKFCDLAAQRGASGADGHLRLRDSKSIRRKPNGMPCYAPKGAAR
jgi:DNA modification methylase